MKEHDMTEWDAGQILVKLSDELSDSYIDLCRGGYINHAHIIAEARKLVSELFNAKHQGKSHTFGL